MAAMIIGGVLLAGSAAGASQRTSARVFQAFSSSGTPTVQIAKTVSGSCFSGSIEADRNDAWRCMSRNFIYDPCFSSSRAKGVVFCPAHAWARLAVKITLTKKLPSKFADRHQPSTSGQPWAMQTTTGLRCVLEGMGPFINSKQFGDYACTNLQWLWDQPNRSTEPWTMFIAGVKAKHLTTKTKIAIAWF